MHGINGNSGRTRHRSACQAVASQRHAGKVNLRYSHWKLLFLFQTLGDRIEMLRGCQPPAGGGVRRYPGPRARRIARYCGLRECWFYAANTRNRGRNCKIPGSTTTSPITGAQLGCDHQLTRANRLKHENEMRERLVERLTDESYNSSLSASGKWHRSLLAASTAIRTVSGTRTGRGPARRTVPN
jgi:hypothetical protein